jgi:hypothetical protein
VLAVIRKVILTVLTAAALLVIGGAVGYALTFVMLR